MLFKRSITALAAIGLTLAARGSDISSFEKPATAVDDTIVADDTTVPGEAGDGVGLINDYTLPEFPEPSEPYEIAVLQAHRSDAYAQSTAIAVEEFAADHGISVTVQDAGGYDGVSVQNQIAQIEAATARGVDAIVIWSTDPTAIIPALEEAEAAGIVIIAWSQAPDFPGAAATVTGDFEQDGYTMATALFDSIGSEGKVISLFGGAGSAYAAALAAGFERATSEYPDIEVVATPTLDDFSPAKVQDLVENYLTSEPDLKGVVTTTGEMAVAALTAIDAAGLTGEVGVVGEIVGDCIQIELLREGRLPILLGVPAVYSAQLVMATTIMVLEGEEVPKTQIIPGNVYTPDNIDEAPLELEVAPEFLSGCI